MKQQIMAFLHRYTTSESDAKILIREFALFRTQQPPFEPERLCWEESDKPIAFWELATNTHFLHQIASRLYSTSVNSIASERAFSVQNLSIRRLAIDCIQQKVNKLAYTYINARILEKLDGKVNLDGFYSKEVDVLSPSEEVILEDILLEIEVDDLQTETTVDSEEAEKVEEEDTNDAVDIPKGMNDGGGLQF